MKTRDKRDSIVIAYKTLLNGIKSKTMLTHAMIKSTIYLSKITFSPLTKSFNFDSKLFHKVAFQQILDVPILIIFLHDFSKLNKFEISYIDCVHSYKHIHRDKQKSNNMMDGNMTFTSPTVEINTTEVETHVAPIS